MNSTPLTPLKILIYFKEKKKKELTKNDFFSTTI